MSKIANRIILVPASVKISLDKQSVFAEGPLGKSESLIISDTVELSKEEDKLFTKSQNPALAGTYNSLIYNLIKGVTEGYEQVLEVKGIGYKVILKDNRLEFLLGKSHPSYVNIPTNLVVKVEGGKIIIKGLNKQVVNKFAANDIRPLRLPSVYKKSKGIYYQDEEKTIKLKPGKTLSK